jgi:G3E family GTPase
MTVPELLPLYVLTGFLGSGKTTLLRNLIRDPDFRDTAVIVNEFGEVGLDHDLLETSEDNMVVLQGGCLCCTVREDLASTIRRLLERRAAGETPPFRRMVIETTGVADPVPVIFTLRSDPRVQQLFRLQGMIVTVDAQNAIETLARNVESVRQAALADRIVITKTDLVDRETVEVVRTAIVQLNPSASILTSAAGMLAPDLLLGGLEHDPSGSSADAQQWLGRPSYGDPESPLHDPDTRHASLYRSISWIGTEKVDWGSFGIWLTMLLRARGDHVLRVKGILDVEGVAGPVAIHGVQHVVHPPVHLQSWPKGPRRSRLVFIVSGVSEAVVRESLELFMRLARLPPDSAPAAFRAGGSGGLIGGRPVRRRMAPAWLKG